MTGEGNQNSSNGYLETSLLDDVTVPLSMEQFSSLLSDLSCPDAIVADIVSQGLQRPGYNIYCSLV